MPEQRNTTRYVSTHEAQWKYLASQTIEDMEKAKANENQPHDIAKSVLAMGSLVERTRVLAQILSPSGRVHVHRSDMARHVTCFPQSACWLFPERP